MDNYLEKLSLSDEEKSKLIELAADSPSSLFSIIQANPAAFKQYFGEENANRLMQNLLELIDTENLNKISEQNTNQFKLGAIISNQKPTLSPPAFDIRKRDQLFGELQNLKSQKTVSESEKARIKQIEKDLIEMLG